MAITAEDNRKLKALKFSTVAIASVVLVEVILGFIVESLAIVSDGLHALLDALTMLVLFVATRASLKPPDEEHMYGHEKFESIGGMIGGIALIGVASFIIYEAVLKMLEGRTIISGFEFAGFIAIGYTFCIDFFRVGTFLRTNKSESSTMKAGFYHAMADLSSTVLALFGFGLATLGIGYGDSLASIVLGILLAFLSVKLVWNSGMELSDTVSEDLSEKVRKGIRDTKGVHKYKDLRVRKAGTKAFVEATILVPDYLNVEEAHMLASEMERNIKKTIGSAEVNIHIEPPGIEMQTAKLIEEAATRVEGVRDVHEIDAVSTDGKLYVTLHAHVDPGLSVEEAHEKTEEIENRVRERLREVENITVHIEPLSTKKKKGPKVDESEIKKIVHRIEDSWKGAFRVKRIVTYVADKKRYINIDCCFTKRISIENAHRVSSQIEENVEKHFVETVVTVHMEP